MAGVCLASRAQPAWARLSGAERGKYLYRIARLLQDRALHRQMSRAARASVQAFWRKDPMVSLYEDFYHRVLGQKGRP